MTLERARRHHVLGIHTFKRFLKPHGGGTGKDAPGSAKGAPRRLQARSEEAPRGNVPVADPPNVVTTLLPTKNEVLKI